MSNDNHPTDKPAQAADAQPISAQPTSGQPTSGQAATDENPSGAKPVRKIVRRSGATRDNAAFAETPAGEAAPQGDGAGADPASVDPLAPRPRATFDARAPRPAPGSGPSGGPSSRPGPRRPPRTSSLGGDFRPPPGRPVGARPIPGGSRAPAEEDARPPRARADGDFRPPPARPIGARPLPGGPRAPAPPGGPEGGFPRRERPRDDRPRDDRPRDDRPRGDRPRDGEASRGAAPTRVAPPAPKPAVTPEPAAPKAATKAVPIFIPLARAGQITPPSGKPALTPKEALAAKIKAQAALKGGAKPAAKTEAPSAASATFDAAHVNATPAEAVEALVKAGDAGAALVEAWASASNAAAIVEAAEAEGTPSAARKAARRALNILRSRGVTIPERQRAAKVEDRAEAEAEAVFTAPDSLGSYVVSISKREPSGRLHLAEVMIREPFGILQAYGGWVSASQLKEARGRQADGYGIAPVPVPTAWARALVARARKLNATSGQVIPLGYDRCTALLEPAPEEVPPHPVADLEAAIDAEHAIAAATSSGLLHAEPEFRGWSADRNAINELLMHLGTKLGPQGKEMAKEAFDAALAEEIAAATDRFFSPEVRATVAGRMRDGAISIRARKGDKAASEVLAVARAITDAGLITSPPREIPFLRQFFELGLRAMAQQTGGELRVPIAAPAAP